LEPLFYLHQNSTTIANHNKINTILLLLLFTSFFFPIFLADIEAECQDDYMKIRIGFNGSFGGLLYSSGYSYDPDCVYINGTGRDYYEFYIQLNRCGTLGKNSRQEDARKNPAVSFRGYNNNDITHMITVQYIFLYPSNLRIKLIYSRK